MESLYQKRTVRCPDVMLIVAKLFRIAAVVGGLGSIGGPAWLVIATGDLGCATNLESGPATIN